MDEGLILQAQEWFDRGTHDIETAQLRNSLVPILAPGVEASA